MRLVEAGQLVRITPEIPSAEMFAKGDAYKMKVYGRPLHPRTCEPNARCLLEAMRAEGDWAVVGGFAIGPVPAYPVRHLWVRNGNVHFDPTWSRRITQFVPPAEYQYRIVSISDYRYFALPTVFPDGNGLEYLTRQAATLGLELLEDHPEAAGDSDTS